MILALALASAGCGGGDDNGAGSAEDKVKENLKAIDAKDAQAFCATLDKAYQVKFTTQIARFTRDKSVTDCPGAFNRALKVAGATGPKFESKPLSGQDIGKIDLKSQVVERGGKTTATVEGPRGQASYDLVKQDGEWRITRAEAG